MTLNVLTFVFIVFCCAALFSRYRSINTYKFTKPLPLLLLLAVAMLEILSGNPQSGFFHWAIFGGLLFGLLGDLALLKEKLFLVGLVFFLIGHILYVLAFHQISEFRIGFSEIAVFSVAAVYGGFVSRAAIKNDKKKYAFPILLYVTAISLMVVTSLQTNQIYFIVGSLLFAFSDAVLGYDKFVSRFKAAQFLILTTYFSGQFMIFFGTFISKIQ